MVTWAKPSIVRNQAMIFYPTLDEMIGEDHPVRLFEELLLLQDWSDWEAEYDLHRGQPPIHPRIIAGAILYGMARRIRSSRQLEDACANRLDFKWLVDGREIDHSTFAKFRTKHEKGLRELFKNVCKIARQLGLISLEEVATDGTKIKADCSRYKTKGAAEISQWLEAIEDQIAEALAEMAANDATEDKQFGLDGSLTKLPAKLRDLVRRKELLEKAQEAVLSIEKKREDKHEASPDKVAKVSVSDPDARILPNKEGGFAPNYTPVVTADSEAGFIVSEGVTNSNAEYPFQLQALSDMDEMFSELPEYMMGDGAFLDLETTQQIEEQGVIPLAPAQSTAAVKGDAAYRDDPTEAVSPDCLDDLPVNKKTGRFTRKAFVFDVENNCFRCPMGKCLSLCSICKHKRTSSNRIVETLVYKAQKEDCLECPCRDRCIPDHHNYRRVERMKSSETIDRMAFRMSQDENKERYNRRKLIAESPFAHIKHAMAIRRFLHRGMSKIQLEWKWICTAYNLSKLIRIIQKGRQAGLYKQIHPIPA
jgi:transposase